MDDKELFLWLMQVMNLRLMYIEHTNDFISRMNIWYTDSLNKLEYDKNQEELIKWAKEKFDLELGKTNYDDFLKGYKENDTE